MLIEEFLRTDSADRSEPDSKGYRTYPGRWVALALFCTLEMANALMWVSFAPISDISQHYFGSGWFGSVTAINMLANVFLILYPFGTIAAVYTVKYFRPRKALIFAGSLTALGCFLRLLAAIFRNKLGDGTAYGLIFLGQAFGALAQPYFTNFAPALSGIWFAVDERDISTSMGAMCSPLGNAFGQLIPPFIVSQSQDANGLFKVTGMQDLMLVELILSLVPLAFAFVFLRDGPPSPPSHSTKLKQSGGSRKLKQVVANPMTPEDDWGDSQQKDQLINDQERGHSSSKDFTHSQSAVTIRLSKYQNDVNQDDFDNNMANQRSHVWEEVQELFRNRDFVLLAISFCVGVGFFNSIMTLLNQIVGPYGYSNDDAGTFGAVFIVCGLIGAGVMGKILEVTKAYLTALRVGIVLAGLANILCFCLLYRDNFWALVVVFGLLGGCVLPLLPAMLENCAECTYPIPEEVSAGILYSGSNLSALGFIFALQYLLEEKPFGPPPFLPSTFFIFGILIVAGIIIAFYNGEYKRHKNELLHAQDQLNAHETKKLKEGQDEEGNGYDVSDHSRIRFTLAEGGMTSANPSLTSKAKKYTPPPVSSALVDQHNSTDVNLVRVASSDGNSSNNRFSTITGSTSMWSSNSRDIQASPSQSQNLRVNNPIQSLVHAAALSNLAPSSETTSPANTPGPGEESEDLHPSFRSNGSGL